MNDTLESDTLIDAQKIIEDIKTWLEKDPTNRSCVVFLNGEDYGSLNAVAGNFLLNRDCFLAALAKNKYFSELMEETLKELYKSVPEQHTIPIPINSVKS